jgi:hypothetical protein
MENRSCFNIIRCFFFLGVMTFLMDGLPTTATQANQDSQTNEGSNSPVSKSEAPAIPSIDAAAPSSFETASFGLG